MPLLSPSPRVKVAALSLAGALMVALPTAQVLRYHGLELRSARAAQAGLDPLMRATALQRALLAHRDSAAQVLRGSTDQEALRRVQQAEVDERAEALAVAVALLATPAAVGETNDLRQDWAALVQRIEARALSAAASDGEHRLLVEQTLQVIDLVVDPLLGAADAAAALAVAALQFRAAAAQALAATERGEAVAVAAQSLARAEQTQARLAAGLQRRMQEMQRERAALLGALGLLGAAAAALALSLRRRRTAGSCSPLPGPAGLDDSGERGDGGDRAEAKRLLHRLRQADSSLDRPQLSETMPPPR